jgi:hypothetical protein
MTVVHIGNEINVVVAHLTPPLVAKYLSQHFARIADPQISRRELSEINQPEQIKIASTLGLKNNAGEIEIISANPEGLAEARELTRHNS